MKPRKQTILNVLNWVESIGLKVYGPCIDLNTGQDLGACIDFSPQDVLKFAKVRRSEPC